MFPQKILKNIICELLQKKFSFRAAILLCLIPSVIYSGEVGIDLRSIIAECKDEFPNCEAADQEIRQWKRK